MSKKVEKCEELRDQLYKVKEDQLAIGKTLSFETTSKTQALTRFVEDKVKFFEANYVCSSDTLQTISHQMEMFNKDHNRLDKEVGLTDFYLNKILPINTFTQTLTAIRSVMDEEDQLKKLKKL